LGQIKLIKHTDYVALIPPAACRVLSSAVLNGGFCDAASFLNLRVDKHLPPPWLPPDETLRLKSAALQLPQPTTAMMTAASMNSLGYGVACSGALVAECWVTAGLGNARRVGDAADEAPCPGTINIWLSVNQTLTDAAMVEALMMLTESKVTVMRDKAILSPVSGLPASGTGTDSHAVFCPDGSVVHPYCGKHTILGELIGRAVTQACDISIGLCLGQELYTQF
jgi:adenosylcobinamide amidohydrolase